MKTAKLVAILDVGFLGAVISVTLFALRGSLQLTFLGILCTVLTIMMYASPLVTMVSFFLIRSYPMRLCLVLFTLKMFKKKSNKKLKGVNFPSETYGIGLPTESFINFI